MGSASQQKNVTQGPCSCVIRSPTADRRQYRAFGAGSLDVIAGSSEFLRLGRDHGYSAARAGVGENVGELGIVTYTAGGVWIATHSKSVGFKRLWIGDGQSLHQHTACALSSFAQQGDHDFMQAAQLISCSSTRSIFLFTANPWGSVPRPEYCLSFGFLQLAS